jgi:hypothetical protein
MGFHKRKKKPFLLYSMQLLQLVSTSVIAAPAKDFSRKVGKGVVPLHHSCMSAGAPQTSEERQSSNKRDIVAVE